MKKLIFALAACAVIASCQKKEDKDPIDVSKTVFLMDGRWQLKWANRVDINDTFQIEIDDYTPRSGCTKDNFFTFSTRTRAAEHEGASKCNVGDPDSTVYGYLLSDNDKHLRIFTNPDEEEHLTKLEGDIVYPHIDSFILSYKRPNPNDSTMIYKITEYYVKQK